MLVLSRKMNEAVIIGADGTIKVTILDVRGDRVRVGIEAPKNVPVHRDEIFRLIEQAGRDGEPGGKPAVDDGEEKVA